MTGSQVAGSASLQMYGSPSIGGRLLAASHMVMAPARHSGWASYPSDVAE